MKFLSAAVFLLCLPVLSYADDTKVQDMQNNQIKPYVSLKMGYNNSNLKISDPANKTFSNGGFSFNPAVGLNFNTKYLDVFSFRLEAEYLRNTSVTNDYSIQRQWRTGTAPYFVYHYETRKSNVNTTVSGLLFNAYIDADLPIINPYIIAGLGYGKLVQENQLIVDTFNDSTVTGGDTTEYVTYSENHSVYNMFYQIGLGVSFDITDKISLNAEFRHIDYGSLKLYDLEYKYNANQVLVGAKYMF